MQIYASFVENAYIFTWISCIWLKMNKWLRMKHANEEQKNPFKIRSMCKELYKCIVELPTYEIYNKEWICKLRGEVLHGKHQPSK